MICKHCWREINTSNPHEYFVSFASGDWLHLKCYEEREGKRNGSTNEFIQSP